MSDDDVLDFMVTEAIMLKTAIHKKEVEEAAAKEAERVSWRKGHRDLAKKGESQVG